MTRGLYQILALALLTSCSKSTNPEPRNLTTAPTVQEEELLVRAMKAYDKGLFTVSATAWSELRDGYPGSYFGPLAEIKEADSLFFNNDLPAAAERYEEFARVHPGHEALGYVRYQIGNCQLNRYRGPEHDQSPLHAAIKSFKQLILDFPSGEYAVLARAKIATCREKLAEHEKFVADFYRKQGLDRAADNRLAELRDLYPDTTIGLQLREVREQSVPLTPMLFVKAEPQDKGSEANAIANAKKTELTPWSPKFIIDDNLVSVLAKNQHAAQIGRPDISNPGSSLATSAGNLDGEASRPSTPQVILANSPIVSSDKQKRSILGELNCEVTEQTSVFTAFLSVLPTLKQKEEDGDKVEAVFQLPELSIDSKNSENFFPESKNCSAGDILFSLGTATLNGAQSGQKVIKASLSPPPDGKISYLILDRPNRLLVVVSNLTPR